MWIKIVVMILVFGFFGVVIVVIEFSVEKGWVWMVFLVMGIMAVYFELKNESKCDCVLVKVSSVVVEIVEMYMVVGVYGVIVMCLVKKFDVFLGCSILFKFGGCYIMLIGLK